MMIFHGLTMGDPLGFNHYYYGDLSMVISGLTNNGE